MNAEITLYYKFCTWVLYLSYRHFISNISVSSWMPNYISCTSIHSVQWKEGNTHTLAPQKFNKTTFHSSGQNVRPWWRSKWDQYTVVTKLPWHWVCVLASLSFCDRPAPISCACDQTLLLLVKCNDNKWQCQFFDLMPVGWCIAGLPNI